MSLKPQNIAFLGFNLDLEEKILSKGGEPVSLPPKALALLLALTERPGHIFTKEDLLDRIWPDTFVEEGNLAYTVRLLRKALNDDSESPKYIETLPRRGYRFIANVELDADIGQIRSVSADVLADGLLIGRKKELVEVRNLLARQGLRIVTLTGPGGAGKTRMAKEIGQRSRELFPNGVFFVELDAVKDPLMVPTVVMHSLLVKDRSWADPADALIHELRDRAALLILDNFEHVLSAAPFVARLMSGTQNLKILVTSREPLRLGAEIEFSVPPLLLPLDVRTESAFALCQYEAVEFFIEKARQVRSSFETLEPDVRAVAEICCRLDGLPLALELAAGRAKILSAPEILEKLEYGLPLLAFGTDKLPERQRTMRSAIEWSYGLLTDIEKDVFSRISVFEGGFTFQAIESILSSDHQTATDVQLLDAVSSLCEKNLLAVQPGSGRTRFRMLVVVREFAGEQLRASGHFETLAKAHAEYYLQIAESAEAELKGNNVASCGERLDLDHDNFRAALRWSLAFDTHVASRIAKSLKLFWMLRGYTREAQYWYREVLSEKEISDEHRWILLAGLANVSQFLGDLDGARDAYESSLAVCNRMGDPRSIAQATRGVAGISYLLGDLEAAQRQSLEAIRISTAAGDDFGIAAASARLGDIALVQDRASDALFHGARALEIFRRLEFMPGVASKLMNLGMASIADGDATSAREYLTESLRIANEIGDYITTRLALEGMVFVLFEEGRQRDSATVSGAAFRMGDEIEHALEPAESRMRELYLAKLRDSLSPHEFAQAFDHGSTLAHADVLDRVTNHTEASVRNLRSITARE